MAFALFATAAALSAFVTPPPLSSGSSHAPPRFGSPMLSKRPVALVRPRPYMPAAARGGLPAVIMFDGPPPELPEEEDAWEELSSELSPLQKQLKKLNPMFFGGAVNSVTVLSALTAWFLTPPIGRVAALGSLALGGVGGVQAGKKMRAARRGLVPSAIADLVRKDGITGLKPKEVARLAERYAVDPAEFERQLSAVYARYLRQLLSEGEGEARPAHVRELGALRRGLGLRWNATESVHVAEAVGLLDGEAPPSDADELPAELAALLWVSSSLFATSKRKATTASLQSALGADDASAQRIVNRFSKPLYRRAVAQAVGKYNSTVAPEVLQTARKALCLSEAAAASVHAAVYDAQLAVLLADGDDDATLADEDMELLGELEGMLQVRGAASALRRRTEPLYELAAQAAVAKAFAAGDDAPASRNAVAMWGALALRQQQLQLPTETAKSELIFASRKLAAETLGEAIGLLQAGQRETALAKVASVASYAAFLGEVLAVTGQYASTFSAKDLAQRYMGALSVAKDDGASAAAAAELAAAAVSAGNTDDPAQAELIQALFSLCDPALAGAREQYAAALEGTMASGDFSDAAATRHRERAQALGVPPALAQRLALDAYYGWLLDAAERGDRTTLEGAGRVRDCLEMDNAAVAELYANTGIDELVLGACCDLEPKPLSVSGANALGYIERQLAARPGVLAPIVAAASDDD